ncbi:MAG: hypothetical protein ACP5PB_05525, partial [Acidimicrobiales bacterium]
MASASPPHHHAADHGRRAKDKSKDRTTIVGVVSAITQPVTVTSGSGAGATTTVTPGMLYLSGPGGVLSDFVLTGTTTVSGSGDQQGNSATLTLANLTAGQRVRVDFSVTATTTSGTSTVATMTATSVKILSNGSTEDNHGIVGVVSAITQPVTVTSGS